MGFGTLFIGYFFLVNISYYAYTDIIAAMVMLLGLYKLSEFNKSFKYGSFAAIGFAVVSLAEISISFINILGSFDWTEAVSPYISSVRYTVIFMLSYFILKGIGAISEEVDARALAATAKASFPLSVIYLVYAAFELPFISAIFGSVVAYIFFALLIAVFAFTISNLVTIYKAYMQICMPEDQKRTTKASKFEFMNKFYDSMEKKSQQYAEYKLKKRQDKNNKRSK